MKNPFSRSALVLLLTCATGLFALSVLLPAYSDAPAGGSTNSARAGTYSNSAIGHAGVYDMLRRLGYPVSRGLDRPLSMVGASGTLVVIEPDVWRLDGEDGLRLLAAPSLLLVLPKWRGVEDKQHAGWLASVKAVPLNNARETLALVVGRGDVLRAPWPAVWTDNALGVAPTGSGVVQLMRSPLMKPVVGTADGMLVGELAASEAGGKIVWVLADPDVLSNHGIGKGDNVAFTLALLRVLRGAYRESSGAPVVFDETVHGFRAAQKNLMSLLFRFPFVVVTALLCASAALLILAGTGRFGAPKPPRPVLDFGKARLIANGAHLLDYAGHHDEVLRRYVRMSIRSAAHSLHAPEGLSSAALAAWLDRVGEARGVHASCSDIMRQMDNLKPGDARSMPRLLACAGAIHRWKGEIVYGVSPVSRRRG